MINFLVFNKILLLVISFIINNYGFSETVEYKKLNDVNENAKPLTLKYPEECKDIIDINNNDKFEIIGSNDISNVITQCQLFIKGKKVKDKVKAGTTAIIDNSIKVTEEVKKGSSKLADSVVKETNYFVSDTVKIKDGIVSGTGKIVGVTLHQGSKIKEGVKSFFKGIFSSEK